MTYLAQSTFRETNIWNCKIKAKNADSMAKWKVKSLVFINYDTGDREIIDMVLNMHLHQASFL